MARIILKAANSVLNLLVILALCTAGLYAGYALWDNNQVYAAAENVQDSMIKLKPVITEEDEGASFEELLAVNPDVCAWVSVDNTNIDFPILQGETNLTYINRDVYGNFALAGSIFLDSRNDKEFHDLVSLLYGHHMEGSDMFGDLDKFKKKAFFDENKTGLLILPDRAYDLEIFACMLVDASEDVVFDPHEYEADINKLLDLTEQEAMHYDADKLSELRKTSGERQLLLLSTCSSEFTDARTIVLTEMKPHSSR
ncbi:MAG: class B sortase [Lachnospiraceae bacterium]|nr:class B sortase [Lachnospiraceae bacterium]